MNRYLRKMVPAAIIGSFAFSLVSGCGTGVVTGNQSEDGGDITVSPTATATAKILKFSCARSGSSTYGDYFAQIATDGQLEGLVEGLWPLRLACDSPDYSGETPPSEGLVATSSAQRSAIAFNLKAEKASGFYEESNFPADEELLYSAYQGCVGNDPKDYYVRGNELSISQSYEIRSYLSLCPNHPQANAWRAGIAKGTKARKSEASGKRVYSGTYQVPKQMIRGTFIARDVKDCYWETRNSSGEILDNNFIISAPRVEVTVGSKAVVFTSDGCGQWNRTN